MPNFIYKAKIITGELLEGTIAADDPKTAVVKLDKMGYFPISVREEFVEDERKDLSWPILQRVRLKDLSIFMRQLADLLEGGISLNKALAVIYQQTQNKKFKGIIKEINKDVQDGTAFSNALTKHPKIFSQALVSMVKSGEIGSMLNDVLGRLADYLEKEEELKGKIISAMTYPLVLSGVGLMTIFFLITFVIPKLVTMFEDMNQILPLPTKLLILSSDFTCNYWWLIIAVVMIIFVGIKRTLATKKGGLALHSLLISLPLWGEVIRKIEVAKFARTLGTLLKNGVPVLEALKVVISTSSNMIIKKALTKVYEDVDGGKGLAEALDRTRSFSPVVVNMLAVSEEGGFLEKALLKIAYSHEQEIDRSIKAMTSLIEPVVILSMGLIVGFIVIAILLPIFKINILIE